MRAGGQPVSGQPLAHDCSVGVITLATGELAYANERQIRVLPLSPREQR